MSMKSARSILLAFVIALPLAGELAAPEKEIPLYPGVAPGSEKWDWSERIVTSGSGMPVAQNVVRPVLQYYPAAKDKKVGTAMI